MRVKLISIIKKNTVCLFFFGTASKHFTWMIFLFFWGKKKEQFTRCLVFFLLFYKVWVGNLKLLAIVWVLSNWRIDKNLFSWLLYDQFVWLWFMCVRQNHRKKNTTNVDADNENCEQLYLNNVLVSNGHVIQMKRITCEKSCKLFMKINSKWF